MLNTEPRMYVTESMRAYLETKVREAIRLLEALDIEVRGIDTVNIKILDSLTDVTKVTIPEKFKPEYKAQIEAALGRKVRERTCTLAVDEAWFYWHRDKGFTDAVNNMVMHMVIHCANVDGMTSAHNKVFKWLADKVNNEYGYHVTLSDKDSKWQPRLVQKLSGYEDEESSDDSTAA